MTDPRRQCVIVTAETMNCDESVVLEVGRQLDDLPFAATQSTRLRELLADGKLDFEVEQIREVDATSILGLSRIRNSSAGVKILHFIGHGFNRNNGLNLVPSRGDFGDSTNLRQLCENISNEVGTRTPGTHVLIVLDMCRAGEGLERLEYGEVGNVWITCASGANSAYFGWFSETIIEVLKLLLKGKLGYAKGIEHVPFQNLWNRIVQRYRRKIAQHADNCGIAPHRRPDYWSGGRFNRSDFDDNPLIFRNPDFNPDSPEAIAAKFGIDPGILPYVDTQYFYERMGRHFSGRADIMRKIGRWRSNGKSDVGLHLVTGAAGSGKSSVVAATVLTSHPELIENVEHRAYLERLNWRRPPILEYPPAGPIAAVHAHELHHTEILQSIANQFVGQGSPPLLKSEGVSVADLRNWMYVQTESPMLIIDALDESLFPELTVEVLLRPLLSARLEGRPICRILVATRIDDELESLVRDLESDATKTVHHRMDEVKAVEIEEYFEGVLLDSPQWKARPKQAADAAEQSAERLVEQGDSKECGAFLVAALYADYLAHLSVVPDDISALAQRIPSSLPEVLRLDLQNIADPVKRQNCAAVLCAVAEARGQGMPAQVIEELALDVFGSDANLDIAKILEEMRVYLRLTTDEWGQVNYLLFNDGLSDHLAENGLDLEENE